MMDPVRIRSAARHWGIRLKAVRDDVDLYGSPERSRFRTAVEDLDGRLFVLEQIVPAQRERRIRISRILEQLHANGLRQVNPYLETTTGEFLASSGGTWWQLSPFIRGTLPDRPAYIRDAQKGEALSGFLDRLYRHAGQCIQYSSLPHFSLKDYILKLEKEMIQHDPDVADRFSPVLAYLQRSFMEIHDNLPVGFCHGDYHPLNIIWRENAIAAVIDWEFCGLKIEIYDIANLVGCVGMEHPSGLVDNLVRTFIRGMRQVSALTEESWRLLPEAVIALRFAWLAEWLRNKDKEMIDLEAVYMNLLIDNRDKLKAAWGL
jgi:homoserine kinase type II